ncbi:MAG: CpsD/CapB family tyrosine-protein kinase [Rubrobacteraceae bacterium]
MNPETTRDTGVRKFLAPYSPLRPHFEELANNLLSAGDQSPVRSVVVTCPEAGAGCSSICLGLGAALSGLGRRSAVVDCNLSRPYLHRILGEPNFVGLTSSLEVGKPLEESGFEAAPELLVVPTGPVPTDPASCLETGGFIEAVRSLEESRDVVLLDAPVADGVLSSPTFSRGFDGILLVVHASRTSKNTARAVTDDLLEAGVNLLGVVLNGGS